MTLCIAAKAFDNYQQEVAEGSVIVCHDFRIETATASAEIGYKWRPVSKDWSVMMAGEWLLALELSEIYRESLAHADEAEPLIERLRRPLEVHRNRFAERFVQSRYARSYDEFLRSGREWLGDQLFREALFELRSDLAEQERKVQLILVGIDDEQALRIFKYSSGDLWECQEFAAIGSGETIAEAALYQRGHISLRSLAETAYTVYEAKRMGEITPGVGLATKMSIVEAGTDGAQLRHVEPKGLKFLERQFTTKFGPRPYKYTELPDGFATNYSLHWKDPDEEEEESSLDDSSGEDDPTVPQPNNATTSANDQT